MRQDCTPTWIDAEMQYRPLRRIRLGDREFSEAYLQETLHACPELLPVDELDADFGPLVSLGREIDNIDNLFIAPSGRITIVETKLWRNPQATREVLAQILEYANRVSTWSFETLEMKCRRAQSPAPIEASSLYSFVRDAFPDEIATETEFHDSVQRTLQTGRFLLLIVGDGIREGMEDLLAALHTHPNLLFTFGLVELQVFVDPHESRERLVVPRVLAHSTEIVRAVVRVETSGPAEVSIEIPEDEADPDKPKRQRKLSEDEFFELVPTPAMAKTIQSILDHVRSMGALVQLRKRSVSVRLADPDGSKQKLSLFVLTVTGQIYTGWLSEQLERIELDPSIADDWFAGLAALVPGVERHATLRDSLSRFIKIDEVEPVLDEFYRLLGGTIEAIQDSAARIGEG
jgi:hypothetical protein